MPGHLAIAGAGSVPAAAGGAFAPSDVSGLVAWYRGATLDAIADADGTVQPTWVDAAGVYGNLTAAGAARPTIETVNGKRVLRFNGSAHAMLTAAVASPTAGVTVCAICNPTGGNGTFRHVAIHAGTNTWAPPYARWAVRANGSNQWETWVDDASVSPANYATGGSTTAGTWRTISLHYDQTNLTARQDGSTLQTKARSGTLASSTQPLILGAATGGLDYWLGDIRELIVYDNGVSAPNLALLDTYCAGQTP